MKFNLFARTIFILIKTIISDCILCLISSLVSMDKELLSCHIISWMCSHSLNNSRCEHLLLLFFVPQRGALWYCVILLFLCAILLLLQRSSFAFCISLASSGPTYALKVLLASGPIGCQEVSTILLLISHLHFVDVLLV